MLDIGEIIEEAFEQVGLESKTGYDVRTARRSLNLITAELGNRGIHLWSVQAGYLSLLAGVATYALPTDTIDVLDVAVRSSDTDIMLERMSYTTYMQTPNKASRGRPSQYLVNRTASPTITFWQVPDQNAVVPYYRMRVPTDVGAHGSEPDIPARFMPVLTSALAAKIAAKRNPQMLDMAIAEYEKQLNFAMAEDRERASFRIVPGGGYYT